MKSKDNSVKSVWGVCADFEKTLYLLGVLDRLSYNRDLLMIPLYRYWMNKH